MSAPCLDQMCGDVLRTLAGQLDPSDLLTFNLTCKTARVSGRQRLLATACARTGIRIALRRTRAARACRAGLAQTMIDGCSLYDRDECFEKIVLCLSSSEDPLSDLTTALHKTQTALIEQSYASPAAARPILQDVGLWIVFVCLAAWRLHMQKGPGVPRRSHAEVAQHDHWGILDAVAVAGPTEAHGAQVPHEATMEGTTSDAAHVDFAAVRIMFQDLLAGLSRMVFNKNPSKKPGVATLNIIVHFLLQLSA